MTQRSLLLVAALALSGASIAGAKSYDIALSQSTKAGNLELRAGEYKLEVKGSDAVFTNVQTEKTFVAPVKIENSGAKHKLTEVETMNRKGAATIQSIDLGGSNQTLEFGD